jgi:hypothetical protein
MNKQNLLNLQKALERVTQALEALEKAIDARDYRSIGARLFEIRHELNKARNAAAGRKGRYP